MGNCFQSPKNNQAQFESLFDTSLPKLGRQKLVDSVPDLSTDIETNVIVYPNENYPEGYDAKQFRQCGDSVGRDQTGPKSSIVRLNEQGHNALVPQGAMSAKQPGFSTRVMNQDKADPVWMKYINNKATGDMRGEADTGSVFAENWDPALFDQRGSPTMPKSHLYVNDSDKVPHRFHDRRAQINSKGRPYNLNWDNWHSNESLSGQPIKRNRTPLISSSILGFSQLQPDVSDSMEWFRNGELESPQPNAHHFLIKGKQKPSSQSTELNENNSDADNIPSSTGLRPEETDYREGWLRYTMFMHQEKSAAANFYANFRKAKYTFLSLEARTGCEIRLSKQLFVYRGKFVRTVVIDGPSRKHILRCYSCLPKQLTQRIILDCERPSISEHRPLPKFSDPETGMGNYPTFIPRAVLA